MCIFIITMNIHHHKKRKNSEHNTQENGFLESKLHLYNTLDFLYVSEIITTSIYIYIYIFCNMAICWEYGPKFGYLYKILLI